MDTSNNQINYKPYSERDKARVGQACVHPRHNPPTHLFIRQGSEYTHTCPSCKHEQKIINPVTISL